MGEDTVVIHKCGMPFSVQSEIDGKKGEKECLPMYYNNMLAPCGINPCPGAIKETAKKAAAIKGGGPDAEEMER